MNQEAAVTDKKILIAGVLFSRASKVEYFRISEGEYRFHDMVVVTEDNAEIIGRIIVPPREVAANSVATNIRPILRKASQADLDKNNINLEKAREYFDLCAKKIIEKGLLMKLVDVFLEETRVIFFFYAEERVDFRALVKDLASAFHTRIEMRQIGARDAAKAIGALGPCGLPCCCETYLNEFVSISIAMAKNQGLSPNPAKLTGMCGKLKCCLSYENSTYLEERKGMIPCGTRVDTPDGTGTIVENDVLRHICTVRMESEERVEQKKFKCELCQLAKAGVEKKPEVRNQRPEGAEDRKPVVRNSRPVPKYALPEAPAEEKKQEAGNMKQEGGGERRQETGNRRPEGRRPDNRNRRPDSRGGRRDNRGRR